MLRLVFLEPQQQQRFEDLAGYLARESLSVSTAVLEDNYIHVLPTPRELEKVV